MDCGLNSQLKLQNTNTNLSSGKGPTCLTWQMLMQDFPPISVI